MGEYIKSIYITSLLLFFVVSGYFIVNKTVVLLTMYTETTAIKIRTKILSKSLTVPKWSIWGLEIAALVFIFWFSYCAEKSGIQWFLFWLGMIVIRIINRCLRGYMKKYFSILDWLSQINTIKNYFFYSIRSLFIETLDLIYTVGLALYFTYFILILRWPMPMYYFIFIALPLYLNFWIYLSVLPFLKLRFRIDENVINIRKFIAYCLLAVLILSDNYSKFENVILGGEMKLDGKSLFLLSSSVVFAALERVFKAGIDHYQSYLKEATSIVNEAKD